MEQEYTEFLVRKEGNKMENKQVKQLLIDCPVCGTRHYIHTTREGYGRDGWFTPKDILEETVCCSESLSCAKSDGIPNSVTQKEYPYTLT